MEVSVSRSLMKSTNRHFLNTLLHSKHNHQLKLTSHPSQFPFHHHPPLATLSLPNPNPNSHNHNHTFSIFNQTSIQSNLSPHTSTNHFAHILSNHHTDKSFEWKLALDDGELGFVSDDNRPIVTVVVLGWLGSKHKHLRRYAEMYNLLGLNAITFPASVNDVLGFDLGRKMETRVKDLSDEILLWLQKKEIDGRERLLIFHTFSNTGWLAYGSILNILQGRKEILEKIKGCVVDSGGDPELDPKVWAAGFTTAILKKQSSAVDFSAEVREVKNGATNANTDEKEPLFTEVLLLKVFEKFFSYLFAFPYVKERLIKVISTLSENQPSHPQLYLYSTSDKVIPFQKVESFAEHQKKLGKQVTTFNFKSTPHVDHYRTFPDTYRSLVQNFLKDCFATTRVSNCTT